MDMYVCEQRGGEVPGEFRITITIAVTRLPFTVRLRRYDPTAVRCDF